MGTEELGEALRPARVLSEGLLHPPRFGMSSHGQNIGGKHAGLKSTRLLLQSLHTHTQVEMRVTDF